MKASDTLTSVAARFDTTPSELAKMNRLATRLVFPGQVLYVPDKRPAGSTTPPTSLDAQDSESQEDGDSTSPKPSADGDGAEDKGAYPLHPAPLLSTPSSNAARGNATGLSAYVVDGCKNI